MLAKLVDSVEKNEFWELEELIAMDQISTTKIPVKFLAGALVIAAENSSIECFNLIVEYNKTLKNQIPHQYINAAFDLIKENYYLNVSSSLLH